MSLELLADVLFHKFDHLVFDRRAFRLGGHDLAVRSACAEVFQFRFVGRLAAREVMRQQTVDHHVGVAADRRREVRVVGERQTVVSDVVGRVIGFGHRAHGHRRHGVFLRGSLYLFEELVQFLGYGAALRSLEDVPEAEDELPEAVEFLLARGVVHAVDHRALRRAAALGPAFAAELRHAAVGQQHELLDHLVRLLLLLEVNA